MGCFSWMFADTGNKHPLNIDETGYAYCPNGDVLAAKPYAGYGEFGGKDIYDLVADWNREYLSKHPEFIVPQHGLVRGPDGGWYKEPDKPVSEFPWYEAYADLSKTREEVVAEASKMEAAPCFEWRWIGVEIACNNDQNAALPYPIKIASKPGLKYENLPASKEDPNQGFGDEEDDDEEDGDCGDE